MRTHLAHARTRTPSLRRPSGPSGAAAPARAQPEVRQILHTPRPQTKLTVGAPDDAFEKEADQVAGEVMRMPEPGVQRMCAECEEEQKIQAKEEPGRTPTVPGGFEQRFAALQGGGRPLPDSERAFFEPRFGRDFSNVRLHCGSAASDLARSVHARAFTLGDSIVLGNGEGGEGGRELLAHELTHVVQQNAATRTFMEPRFGHDFSRARIHTDAEAAQSAGQLQIQGAGQNAILRRKPDPKGPHTQPDEARLRVKITDTLETIKRRALDSVIKAIERGDRAYLQGLQLTSRQVDDLLNRTSRFSREFGTALERQIELSVRANPDISNYVKKGPHTVPRGVGKPDWIIETPSSRIAVELTTVEQLEKKLKDWRSQHPKTGKPKWYVEKSLNLTYEIPAGLKTPKPPGTGVPFQAAGGTISTIAQGGTKTSKLRTAGRFLAREAPNLALQAAVMLFFPPGVIIHNDKIGELSQKKIDPPIQDILAKLGPLTEMPLALDLSRIIYGNVTVKLEYTAGANSSGDLILDLKDATFLRMDISNDYLHQNAQKFDTSVGNPTKQITYSFVVYEPESVIREREAAEADRQYREWLHEQPNYKKWARAQKEYEECVQRYGTGFIPPPAGAEEASQYNPEAGPCIPPRMEPMEGP